MGVHPFEATGPKSFKAKDKSCSPPNFSLNLHDILHIPLSIRIVNRSVTCEARCH